jgi:carboxymethylenebutenolidase
LKEDTILIESVWIEVDGDAMEMWLALPSGTERRPGILLSHYQHGLASFTRHNAERLASLGYVVVAPDHYHHAPSTETNLKTRKEHLIDTRLINDMRAATLFLRSHPRTLPEKTAIMGHCMGGRQALLGAATVPGFQCALDFYGGGVMRAQGPGPSAFERLSAIQCPVAGFFGVDDRNPPLDQVHAIEAELKRIGLETDFHIYENTGHAFMDPEQARYVEASAQDAWRHALAFLSQHLKA